MKIKIIQVTAKGKIDGLDSLLPKGFKIPDGFSLVGLTRNLVVVSDVNEVIIAIGPEMHHSNYNHDNILCILRDQFPNATYAGSGSIVFSFYNGWEAKLCGEHTNALDPGILTDRSRKEIKKILRMPVHFIWSRIE